MKWENAIYIGAENRASVVDFEEPSTEYKDIILFIHGYKGYKDWGAWSLVQDYFVQRGLAFCKFNLSHNGGTVENPIDFPDLAAFARNFYRFEVIDVECIIEWLTKKITPENKRIHLIGHSRGGGIAVLSAHYHGVSSLTTWASIADIEARFPKGKELEAWKKNGVYYVKNSRTHQEMPQAFSIYEDWQERKDLLDIKKHAESLKKPALHIHGANDETVSMDDAKQLAKWTTGEYEIIPNATHTFGTFHPYPHKELPKELEKTCHRTFHFIQKNCNFD